MLKHLLKTEKARNKPSTYPWSLGCTTTVLHALFIPGTTFITACIAPSNTSRHLLYSRKNTKPTNRSFPFRLSSWNGTDTPGVRPLRVSQIKPETAYVEYRTWACHDELPLIFCYSKAQPTAKPTDMPSTDT